MRDVNEKDFIIIENARHHNLDISVTIPKNKFTVISGVSGSGKTSLAFYVIHAEAQRRYIDSLPSYVKQFLPMYEAPKVQSIRGLSPSIAINQKNISDNPRSNVSTITEIYDYLRVLFSKIGTPYSPVTGRPIKAQTVSEITSVILGIGDGKRIYIVATVVKNSDSSIKHAEIDRLKSIGYVRFLVNGVVIKEDELNDIANYEYVDSSNNISVIVDRLVISNNDDTGKGFAQRVSNSVENALKIGKGVIEICILDDNKIDDKVEDKIVKTLVFSELAICHESGFSIPNQEPRIFSFNNPVGACDNCTGVGTIESFDVNIAIPNDTLSIEAGVLKILEHVYEEHPNVKGYFKKKITELARENNFSVKMPFSKIPEEVRNNILYDSNSNANKKGRGVLDIIGDLFPDIMSQYKGRVVCPKCKGSRLKEEVLCIKVGGLGNNSKLNIYDVTSKTVEDALIWIENLQQEITEKEYEIAEKIISAIRRKLALLFDMGLGYVTLHRNSSTLSGGEAQRIKLAANIGSGLTGVLYILDEPSIGLHTRDNKVLIENLKSIRDLGNTVVVIEHDEEIIESADHLIEIGPFAGVNGGKLVSQGSIEDVISNESSLLGKYLADYFKIPLLNSRRKACKYIHVKGFVCNNIIDLDFTLPLENLVCVTGVSGSGKSTLVNAGLCKIVQSSLSHNKKSDTFYKSVSGIEYIDKIITIDQKPIGRTSMSNPATYIGVFNEIRSWYASLQESKIRGYKIGRFSFNTKGGRCEKCCGHGILKIEMLFLPPSYIKCEECNGKKYNRETLEVLYQGKNIYDILEMSVEEACVFFQHVPKIKEKLQVLINVGLGYLKIGQPSTTLSGGEAQRIKLSKELLKKATGRTLYTFDEPTTGLHMEDILLLLKILNDLVSQGNSIVIVEHNLHIIKNADYIIDIGPEGGKNGGKIVATGTPEEILASENSITGKFLSKYLVRKTNV